MKRFLVLSAAAIAVTTFSAEKSSAQTKIIMNASPPKLSAIYRGMFAPWRDNVEKATQGRIDIFEPAASMAPGGRQWELVASEGADVAMTPHSVQRNRLRLPMMAELPFTTPSAVASSLALWQTQQKYFNKANEFKGMKLLAQWVSAGYSIQSRGKAILKASDLKGEKVRTAPGVSKFLMSKLGGSVVVTQVPASFELISKGTVDSMLNGHSIALAFKYARYLKNVTDFPGMLGTNSFAFIMNQKTWDGLSKQDQDAILSVSGPKAITKVGFAMDGQNRAGLRMIKKFGAQAHQASPEFIADAKKRLAFLEADWIKKADGRGVNGAEALAFYKKTATTLDAKFKKMRAAGKGRKGGKGPR